MYLLLSFYFEQKSTSETALRRWTCEDHNNSLQQMASAYKIVIIGCVRIAETLRPDLRQTCAVPQQACSQEQPRRPRRTNPIASVAKSSSHVTASPRRSFVKRLSEKPHPCLQSPCQTLSGETSQGLRDLSRSQGLPQAMVS